MTTAQRIEAYKFVLKRFESNDPPTHICSVLLTYHCEHIKIGRFDILKYPELLAQKPFNKDVMLSWFPFGNVESRITALRNAITLAESNLYHETVKTAVNELGLETLPFSLQGVCTDILRHMITMNGVTGKDFVEFGYRARIAELLHDHELHPIISKEKLYDTNKRGRKYMYMRHYVKPEHVEAVVLAYLRINCPKEVKARKLKVLEAVQDCGV